MPLIVEVIVMTYTDRVVFAVGGGRRAAQWREVRSRKRDLLDESGAVVVMKYSCLDTPSGSHTLELKVAELVEEETSMIEGECRCERRLPMV